MTHSRFGASWAGLAGILIVCLAVVMVPVFLIRPFVPQTPASITLAFALRRWSPAVTLGGASLALLLGLRLWRAGPSLRRRVGAALLVLPAAGTAWLARQNHFEWMFAPLPDARFVRAAEASFVAADAMVLAVALGGDAVAYPVPQLAYHHLVNDEVGRVPIVATY